MNSIQNYSSYNAGMARSLQEKLFFVGKVNTSRFDTIIDFGCANGEFLAQLHIIYPHCRLIGYDIDSKMLELAHEVAPTAELYSDWNTITFDPSRTLLNLSSVIHEVYSYSTEAEVALFWQRVTAHTFSYVCVRDMMIAGRNPFIPHKWKETIINRGYQQELTDFEAVWGAITHQKQMMHFFMKYRYKDNWTREVNENYLPITLKDLMDKVENYSVNFFDHSNLAFLTAKIESDFGIDISNIPTHIKLILTNGT